MPKPDTRNTTEVQPDPKLEKRTRRIFTVEYKLSILQQADACKHGELGALLRREKLYSNQLSQWRREFATDGVEGLSKSQPGPKSNTTPEQKRIAQLEKENARLQQQLAVKNSCIDLQKKALALIEQAEREDWS
ncbi:MAG: transposase [Thiothrix litoralis]